MANTVTQKRGASVTKGKKPASILAQEKLLKLFQNSTFKSEETLKESVLATQFGVTRHAMREALNQAIGWGVVEYKPYCGYRIRKITIYDLLDFYEVREAIEPIAARAIAQTRPRKVLEKLEYYFVKMEEASKGKAENNNDLKLYSSKFHLTVVNNCGNRNFAHMQNISNIIATFYFNSIATNTFYRHNVLNTTASFLGENFTDNEYHELNTKLTIDMHRKMIESLKSGNAEEAEKLFRELAYAQVKNLRNIILFQKGTTK